MSVYPTTGRPQWPSIPCAAVIDLHCHILPGLDDGPADMAGSLELAQAAAAAGTRTITATPHIREDVFQLLLGLCPAPAFLDRAKRQIAPLPIGTEAQGKDAARLQLPLNHLPGRPARHGYLSRRRRLVLPLATDRKQLNLAPSASRRPIRPLTRAGGRIGRRFLTRLSQHARRDPRVEAKPWFGPTTQLDRAQLDRVRVDPGALDAKAPRQLGGIDQLSTLQAALFKEVKSRVVV